MSNKSQGTYAVQRRDLLIGQQAVCAGRQVVRQRERPHGQALQIQHRRTAGGQHPLDLMEFALPQVVTRNKRDAEGKLISVDDNALCILKMSGGALGTMAASWTVYGHECQSTVLYGTRGLMMIYSEPSAPIIVSDLEGNRTSFAFDTTSEKSGVIDEFVDALVHDRDPEVSGKEALTTMRTIFGSIRSSDIARPVAVNTDFVTHI